MISSRCSTVAKLTCLLLLTSLTPGFAQRCISQQQLQLFLSRHPAQQQLRDVLEHTTFSPIQNRSVITLPVVFHIVWNSPTENISDQQSLSQLLALNRDFRLTNPSNGLIPPLFQPLAADMEINFCLAQRDPNGLPSSGINRVQTALPFIGDRIINGRKAICYSADGGANAWNPDQYINIWVGARQFFPAEASFPAGALPTEDGIIADPRFVGTTGTAAQNQPYHLGHTITHEIGHYLNLYHLWGPNLPGSCNQSDDVEDTPAQSKTYISECPTHPQISCGSPDMFMNFMNFTNDACMAMFSIGQKQRARHTLNTFRSGLLSSPACQAPLHTIAPATPHRISLITNPATDAIQLNTSGINGQWLGWYLFTAQGQIAASGKIIGAEILSIPLPALPSGLYFFSLSGMETPFSVKIIVAQQP